MWSEQWKGARRCYQKEIQSYGDSWELRLRLGNCNWRAKCWAAARSNYRWAFLLGLPRRCWMNQVHDSEPDTWARSIEDPDLIGILRTYEDPDWSFSEACLDRILPGARLPGREEFEKMILPLREKTDSMSGDAKFCLYWMISENKVYCSDELLREVRLGMKALNPRLHGRYMAGLK